MTAALCPLEHDKERWSSAHGVLCDWHCRLVDKVLAELATFDRDADKLSEGKTARHDSAPLTGDGDTPLPIDPRAADLRVNIRGVLSSWAALVAEERGITPPDLTPKRVVISGPLCFKHAHPRRKDRPPLDHQSCIALMSSRRPQNNTLAVLSAFLRKHLDWSLAQPWVDDYATEILELGRRAHALLNPSGRRQFQVGQCVEQIEGSRCTGTVWALLLPADPYKPDYGNELVCDQCDHRVPSNEWLTYGRRVKAA